MAGVALFALQSSAAALVPAALGKGDKNDDDTDATDAARRVADRCMGWGLFAGTALGLLQIACLPLVRCFSPLPEVRAAARTPAFLSAWEPVRKSNFNPHANDATLYLTG